MVYKILPAEAMLIGQPNNIKNVCVEIYVLLIGTLQRYMCVPLMT